MKPLHLDWQIANELYQFPSNFKTVKRGAIELHKQIIKVIPAGSFCNFLFFISTLLLNIHMAHESHRTCICGQYLPTHPDDSISQESPKISDL